MENNNASNDEVTILEITRLIKEFQAVFREKTSQTEQFLTINELESLWSELRNNTEVLYSDMIRDLISTVDEREMVRKKKSNIPKKE